MAGMLGKSPAASFSSVTAPPDVAFRAVSSTQDLAPKLRDIIEHVRVNPMPIGGGVMYYHKPKPVNRLADLVHGLTQEDVMGGEPREPWSKVILALAYLGVGGLDEAHDTVQHMTHVQEANYVHALLHRREGERVGELRLRGWSNSSYWWDQTGRHPLFESLQKKAEETSQDLPAVRERLWGVQPPSAAAWDPDKMVMLMAAIKSGAPPELCTAPVAAWCVGMQHFEWESLLLHCHEAATASAASS